MRVRSTGKFENLPVGDNLSSSLGKQFDTAIDKGKRSLAWMVSHCPCAGICATFSCLPHSESPTIRALGYLHGFKAKAKAAGPNTIEYKIGEIFGEIKNRIQSGYNLREIIDHINQIKTSKDPNSRR